MRSLALALAAVMAATAAAAPLLRVLDPWMRPAFMEGATTAGYLRLENPGTAPITIVRVTSPVAAAVELHRVRHDGDLMRMEMLDSLTVAPRGAIALAPKGPHLMFIGVTRRLAPGERVPVRFELADGGAVDAMLLVRADGESR